MKILNQDIIDIPPNTEHIIGDKLSKKNKLIRIVTQLLHHSHHRESLKHLMTMLNLTESDVIQAYLNYNLAIEEVSNTIFTDLTNRFVLHLHNLNEESWHHEKQTTILKGIETISPKSIIEVGFGVPTSYINKYILKHPQTHLTLCDFDQIAFDFSKALLSVWDKNWEKNIHFKNENMNDMNFLGDYDVYLFPDCIDHTLHPTEYLKKQVLCAKAHSKFILILAIGPHIPMHYCCWETLEAALQWLNVCGLKIDDQKVISTNPEIDLFAQEIPFKFGYFCCSKQSGA